MSGLVWRGPLFGVAGYAQEAREFVLGLDALGVRVRVEDVPLGPYPDRLAPETERRLRTLLRTRIDGDAARIEHGFPPRWSAGARAGRTMFETDRLPADWVPICNSVPDVWVPSRFNLETFAAAGVERERLHVLPGPIRVADWQEADPLELPTREFTFLSVFDWSLRKGWDLLLAAYTAAFSPGDDVTLVLKIHSSLGRTGAELRQLVADAAGHRAPPIHVLVGVLPARDLPGLYRAADCFVLPTRGEGCGRPFAEAMAAGVPVIGTAWGGQTDLLGEDTGYPIEVQGIVPVPERAIAEAPAFGGHRWAEPSVEHLTSLLRRVYERRDEALARARRARAAVAVYDTAVVCAALAELLGAPDS